jgi:hypothetical protein
MLKITKAANGEGQVVFTLSGRMDAENAAELKSLFSQEAKGRRKVLALEDVTLVDQDAVSFLERFEVGGLEFQDCPAYLREWIGTERGGSSQQKR